MVREGSKYNGIDQVRERDHICEEKVFLWIYFWDGWLLGLARQTGKDNTQSVVGGRNSQWG